MIPSSELPETTEANQAQNEQHLRVDHSTISEEESNMDGMTEQGPSPLIRQVILDPN